ncbi:2-keto-4-pentenoate hydratase/2-oxohepta-3-ene-1,7-dioic acid hydratase (catechol pathway) [Microbacterium azadirachtae]|uniref:2-keto-4-pentenoate hydratase/2-oxohepta-3-ene-1,7-dioic acid hydratase (Catechol pathway) n=1 Tax=Microbacterium azadirachtae TaxID=582680 RepID=A0A1I6IQD3_9MICO|nr:fumarylacetoacetate hydrolase family protein [Microbacterium azadirachtae]SFR68943.1 2-keto-4-pentenoate hydratase/2-oxohepta-3-ene-1,7-dioic acid hydratase (catechol pathway) [Microbacterium azadirachtae]
MPAPIDRPGKIIAIHLNYRSRADQRGRTPAAPSYFFKPSSSVAGTDGVVERPAGTELLAFEGEIALIIGTPARRVSVEDAWSHVAWVTASNDLGLYDLRANDKGSNVRSKGGDGYTPLGPELIPAAEVDPAQLRVRAWVNGDLRQDDETGDLLFPLPQLIADLSQHFTLEPGDVILTGTPAGSSVIVPGDVVVIEVDAPHSSKTFSSGGLRTTVVQGDVPFDGALGSLPAVDDLQRAEAWGSREAAGLAPEAATAAPAPALDPALREKLLAAPTAGLSSQLRKRGLHACFIDGVSANAPGAKIVGTAKTLRFVPAREDLFKTHGGGYNAQKRAFDAVEEGEVIVIEARGDASTGTLGDILALRAKVRGAAGVVTDGGVRDYAAVAEIGLPVFSQGAHPSVLGRKHVPWDVDVTIACGGAAVQPGDIIVGDSDGVIVIPPSLAEEVADAALAQEEEDAWIAEQVEAGHPVDGLFPMDAAWRAKYDAAHATGPEEA